MDAIAHTIAHTIATELEVDPQRIIDILLKTKTIVDTPATPTKKTKPVKPDAPKKAPKKTTTKFVKPAFLIPFCGVVDENRCLAVKYNKGLNTQCYTKPKKGEDYCGACLKQAQANDSGRPNYGDIRDHAKSEPHTEYINDKGKKTIPYIDIISKLKTDDGDSVTMDMAITECDKYSYTIPECDTLSSKKTKTKTKTKTTTPIPSPKDDASPTQIHDTEDDIHSPVPSPKDDASPCKEVHETDESEPEVVECVQMSFEGVIYNVDIHNKVIYDTDDDGEAIVIDHLQVNGDKIVRVDE